MSEKNIGYWIFPTSIIVNGKEIDAKDCGIKYFRIFIYL